MSELEIMSIKIGNDEFCIDCMEWQECDEDGRCKVCGKIIFKQKAKDTNQSYAEYERETTDFEDSEE